MMKIIDPILKDAQILANALLSTWCLNDFGHYEDEVWCKYCSGKSSYAHTDDPKSLQHDPDCPILVAFDILTGIEQGE